MIERPLKILSYVASAVLIILGIIFMMSSNMGIIYFFEGLTFTAIGIALVVLSREKKPIEIKQTVTMSGPVKVKEVRCPICNAVVDTSKVELIVGKPYVTCSYCNNKFELTEEPTW
jgi:uncharacterized Zn-finger protein